MTPSTTAPARAPRFGLRCLLLGAGAAAAGAALQLLAGSQPGRVEELYSQGLYPWISRGLGLLTGWSALSFAEPLAVGLVGVILWRLGRWLIRLLTRRGTRPAVPGLGLLALLAGFLYLSYVLLWGLNHQRLSFAEQSGLAVRPSSAADLEQLATELAARAAELRQPLAEDEAGVMRLPRSTGEVLLRAPQGYARAGELYSSLAVSHRAPKGAALSRALSALSITGIFIPFTAEAHVNVDYPAPGIPFVACHELAHLHGYAREDEANYLGTLACRLHPDPEYRYSGTLAALLQVLRALSRADPEATRRIRGDLDPALERDRAAFQAFWERHHSALWEVTRVVNDAYLKSQGHAEGVQSYGRAVDLLLAEWRAEGLR